jgi:hypothetical protein
MMIDCNKAGQMIDQGHHDSLSWWGKRKLKFHLGMCRMCKKYDNDNEVLSKVIKMAGIKYSNKCISQEEKNKIKEHLANHKA